MSGVHPHPAPGCDVERIERSSPPRVETSRESLSCECGLRPYMKLSLSEKNYRKIYLTCGVNQRGMEEFGKVHCQYFQWIHWKRRVLKDQQQQGPEKLWKGRFVVTGSYNTIMFPEEFRNLDSRLYLKSAYEGMKVFPEWKTEMYMAALTRYLKEEGQSAEVVQTVRRLKKKLFCSHHLLPRV